MRAIGPAFDEKLLPQTHDGLEALKEGLNAKVERRSAGLYWKAEVELGREKRQNRLKTLFNYCKSGRDHG